MNEQSTILNGPSGELTMAFKDAKSPQETTHQPASDNVQLPTNFPPQNSVSRPPLTRVDSRTFTPRPNFPNQQGVPYRPPPVRQPGAPQFIQRNTGGFVQRPGLQQQHQQQLPLQQNFQNQNIRPYGNVNINPPQNQNQSQGLNQNINPGIRPSTPFPPRPQGPIVRPAGLIAQRSVPTLGQTRPPFNGDQLTRSQTLDTSEIPKHVEINKPTTSVPEISKEETPKPAITAMKNRSFSLSSNAESNSNLNEDRRRSVSSIGSVEENHHATDEKNDYPSRPESRAGFMNKIEEDVNDCKTNRLDSPLVVSNEASKTVESAEVNKSPEIKVNQVKTDHVRIGENVSKEDDENIKDAKTEKESSKLQPNTTDRIKPPKTLSPSKSEGDNDSGVDESTQGNDQSSNGEHNTSRKSSSKAPSRNSSSPTKSRSFSRGSKSPHPKTPDSGASTPGTTERKKLPMNKIQVGSAPSPNLKVVKSKIGSLENASYKPGGGRVKIENRKIDFSNAQPRIAAKNDVYQPGGGDKKIQQQKLQWNAKSKIGSLENASHKPKGGDKKIETVKLDFKEKAKPKVGSKDNIKHVAGGGEVKSEEVQEEVKQEIENKKLEIKVQSKVGSLDNVKHKPGGGDKKIFDDKDYIRQKSSMSNENKSMSGSQIKQVKKVTYKVDTVEISVVPSKKERLKIFETVYEPSDSRPSSRLSRSGSAKSKSNATPREPWRY